ncbi:MAG: hypothetical protein AAF202_03750, partial [Pseudomonadota bacterium]
MSQLIIIALLLLGEFSGYASTKIWERSQRVNVSRLGTSLDGHEDEFLDWRRRYLRAQECDIALGVSGHLLQNRASVRRQASKDTGVHYNSLGAQNAMCGLVCITNALAEFGFESTEAFREVLTALTSLYPRNFR